MWTKSTYLFKRKSCRPVILDVFSLFLCCTMKWFHYQKHGIEKLFAIANEIWRVTNLIVDCWNNCLIHWHTRSAMKSHHIIFGVLTAYALNHWLFNAYLISVQLKWITSAKRKFQIFPDYAGICQIFPENSRFCHRHGKI